MFGTSVTRWVDYFFNIWPFTLHKINFSTSRLNFAKFGHTDWNIQSECFVFDIGSRIANYFFFKQDSLGRIQRSLVAQAWLEEVSSQKANSDKFFPNVKSFFQLKFLLLKWHRKDAHFCVLVHVWFKIPDGKAIN